ncbi:MAG: hypothetical protein GKC04_01965 [Methanomicrobiales archaeon]|nr:hypothetical protein [Methanomicrobiales archaeon]
MMRTAGFFWQKNGKILAVILVTACCLAPAAAAGTAPPDAWHRIFDGSEFVLYSVISRADGSYVAGGEAGLGAAVVFLNASGYPERVAYVRATTGSAAIIWARETADGGLLLVSDTQELIATDNAGKPRWSYPAPENLRLQAIDAGGEGAVLAFDDGVAQVTSVSGDGSERWSRQFAGSADGATLALRSIRAQPGGGIVAGGYAVVGTGTEGVLLGTDRDGNRLFEWRYPDLAAIPAVAVRGDGGYAFCGYAPSGDAIGDVPVLASVGAGGDLQWQRPLAGYCSACSVIVPHRDGGYLLAGALPVAPGGRSGGDVLLRTDSLGTVLWSRAVPGGVISSVQQAPDGGYVIGGISTAEGGDRAASFLLKIEPETSTTPAAAGSWVVLAAGICAALLAAGLRRRR